MADTSYTDGVTLTAAEWFNDVNRLHYTLLQDPASAYYLCNGRLTLTTGTPVTTGDVTAAGTLYFAPYKGSKIALYDGSTNWKAYNFTELSLALTLTSGKPYDIFCYDSSGTPTLESLVWTNDTTRATALTTQNGVLVKTGATTRRYLGTIYASGTDTTEDSAAKRYVWNYYNRVARPMRVLDATNTWTYTTATFRAYNNAATNALDFVVGVSEDLVSATAVGVAGNITAGVAISVGIGLDATDTNSAHIKGYYETPGGADVNTAQIVSAYEAPVAVGRHTLTMLEYSEAAGTTNWYGDGGVPTVLQAGIYGTILG